MGDQIFTSVDNNNATTVKQDDRLLEAALNGQTDLVLQLLEEEGQTLHSFRDKDGKTALHLASSAGHSDTVAALILNGADVAAQDHTGHNALQKAASEGHFEVAKLLLERGAPVDHQDEVHGNTALHESSWRGFSRTVDLLCRNKSNFYLRNRGGFSALHLCCQNGHNETCRVLLRAGCKPNIKNNYGDTPIHTAARYGHAGVARIIMSANCNQTLQNKNGDTALHIASAMGRKKLVRILLECSSQPDEACQAVNLQRETALDIANRKDYREIAEILRHPEHFQSNDNNLAKSGGASKTGNRISGSGGDATDRGAAEETRKSRRKSKNKKSSKHQKSCGENGGHHVNFSPYGCHYYPDLNEFPAPDLGSLPQDPLAPGEQYYLDLAGNIKKGPTSDSYTCYCTPMFSRFEQKMDKNKKEVVRHLEATHGKLAHRISSLERKTRDQISGLSNSMKETIAQERVECHDRIDRRAIRERIAIDRHSAARSALLRQEMINLFEQSLKGMEERHRLDIDNSSQLDNLTIMRSALRGSKRKKRALRSQLQSGHIRRAMSEDELEKDDEDGESMTDKRLRVEDEDLEDDDGDVGGKALADKLESLTVQSEMDLKVPGDGGLRLSHFNPGFAGGGGRGLVVADRPVLPHHPVYQNTAEASAAAAVTDEDCIPTEVYHGRTREIYQDFGDFKTQELDSLPSDNEEDDNLANRTDSATNYSQDLRRVSANFGSEFRHLEPSRHQSAIRPPDKQQLHHQALQQQLPVLPPKKQCPPPYRSPPQTVFGNTFVPGNAYYSSPNFHSMSSPGGSLGPVQPPPQMLVPASSDYFNRAQYNQQPHQSQPLSISSATITTSINTTPSLLSFPPPQVDSAPDPSGSAELSVNGVSAHAPPTLMTSSVGGAASSSDGSHDSHNDSGYCLSASGGAGGRFGSGGPSPSLSGSQGRPDSRGCPVDIEMASQHSSFPSKPHLKPPLMMGGIVAPRIKQLQLSLARQSSNSTQGSSSSNIVRGTNFNSSDPCPKGSLV